MIADVIDRMISGSSHARYDHKSRPTQVEVRCPACGAKCEARKESEIGFSKISSDLLGTWHTDDWQFTCSTCVRKRENLSYDDLPSLFYDDGQFWAWNTEHLLAVEAYLKGDLERENEYMWFMSYLEKGWLKERSSTLKAIERMKNL